MAARADYYDIHNVHCKLQEFIELSDSYTNLGFCVVAGNPSYLSTSENAKQISKMVELVQYISDRNGATQNRWNQADRLDVSHL